MMDEERGTARRDSRRCRNRERLFDDLGDEELVAGAAGGVEESGFEGLRGAGDVRPGEVAAAYNAAVAGGILSFGDTYGGACQQLAERLVHHRQLIAEGTETEDAAAQAIVRHFFGRGEKVPGYGHALHPEGDPRVPRLYAIADEDGVTGVHSRLAQAVEAELGRIKKRPLPMNQDGALAALGLDMGLDWQIVRALAFIPRSAGLAVHAVEEMKREAGWRHVPNDEIDYDGPPRRPLNRS